MIIKGLHNLISINIHLLVAKTKLLKTKHQTKSLLQPILMISSEKTDCKLNALFRIVTSMDCFT